MLRARLPLGRLAIFRQPELHSFDFLQGVRRVKTFVCAATSILFATTALAEVQSKELTYGHGETELQGYLAWDGAQEGKRPGVLVVHEWWGHNAHARRQADRLAEAGYVAFALDMYGKGKVTTHPADAQAFVAEITKDLAVLTERFEVARALLAEQPQVDPEKIGAIGYCFGGTVVLNMARSGADLEAVASFHGGLGNMGPAKKDGVHARVLVLNGADDAMVTDEQVAAFESSMKDAGATFEVVHLEGARHSFTNPDADKVGIENLAYNAEADAKSWSLMLEMMAGVFGK